MTDKLEDRLYSSIAHSLAHVEEVEKEDIEFAVENVMYVVNQRNDGWISVEDRLPEGKCLVYLEEELLNIRIHSANFHPNITMIGGNFEFDAPKVTHWQPLPQPPQDK